MTRDGLAVGRSGQQSLEQPRLRPPGRTRHLVVTSVTGVVSVLLGLVALGIGDFTIPVPEVVQAILHDEGFPTTVVMEWRMPRVLAALVLGAALAVSGVLFQSLTRNPLGSPDVIGFSAGSFTGVLIGTTLLPAIGIGREVWALAGGLGAAVVVYLLAYRRGVQGFRLIVTGIAVTAMLQAFNVWLQLRAEAEVAMTASAWASGALDTVDWAAVHSALIALAVCFILVAVAAKPLRQLELGDAQAAAHGLRIETSRALIVVLGVALTAIPTAVVGPIAFISLVAPQVAKRLTGGAGLPLVQSALVGGLLLLAADQVAQHALAEELPVGVITVVLGGCYLVALLVRGASRRA